MTILAAATLPASAASAARFHAGAGPRFSLTPACTTTFTATRGDWEHDGNWDHGVPDASSVACVPNGSSTVTLSSTATVQAVLVAGTLDVDAPGALLLDAPRSVHSRIATLDIHQATIGGSGWVEATGDWTLYSVSTMTTRWPVPMPAPAPPNGGGVTEIDPGATVSIDANGECPSGSNLRDGHTIQNDAGGTFTLRSCAAMAADWGTTFDNRGTVRVESSFGYYGFLAAALGWPKTPPQLVNSGTITMRTTGEFVLGARYTGTGTAVVPTAAQITIPDHPATGTIAFNTAPRATASIGGSCSGRFCTPTVDSTNPVSGSFANAAIAGAPTRVSLVQNANDQTGKVFVKTARPGGHFWWPVTKGSFSYTQTNGRATTSDPYIVTMMLDRTLLKGKAVSEFGIGSRKANTNILLPACAKGVPLPCVVSKRIIGGDLRIVVKTVQPKQIVGRFYPMGPRLYK